VAGQAESKLRAVLLAVRIFTFLVFLAATNNYTPSNKLRRPWL
jgi:hypothetical protein